MRLRVSVLLAATLAGSLAISVARADTLHVIGAGSLTGAFTDLLRRFPAGPDRADTPEFGPSGLMRRKIEQGTPVDLFASADMDNARALAAGHPERPVINFTRNRLCALARPAVGLTPDTMLDRLLDPAVRVATSTPGADPGGDDAFQVFARAEAVRPGARAALEKKALVLVGGGDRTPLLVPGKGAVEGVFLADRADVMLGYCSGSAGIVKEVPGLVNVVLPPELTVGPAYGMVLMNDKPATLRFAAFVMSEAGQGVLSAHGFAPVGLADAAQPPRGVTVQRAGRPGTVLSPEALARLPAMTQQVAGEHGAASYDGPRLWDVLVASGAIDPSRHAEDVHLAVRVTGADGYVAVLAMGELSPEFAARPIQLALGANGALRLVVPGEKRAGRSVRDVIRMDVE